MIRLIMPESLSTNQDYNADGGRHHNVTHAVMSHKFQAFTHSL